MSGRGGRCHGMNAGSRRSSAAQKASGALIEMALSGRAPDRDLSGGISAECKRPLPMGPIRRAKKFVIFLGLTATVGMVCAKRTTELAEARARVVANGFDVAVGRMRRCVHLDLRLHRLAPCSTWRLDNISPS